MGPDEHQQSVVALVWVNARFRLHLRSPGAACRRPSGVIRPSAPLPSVAARAVRRQTRNKLFGSTRAVLLDTVTYIFCTYTQSHRFQFGEAEESFGGEEQVQFVKAIVGESSLKGFDVLKADARERRMCDVGQKWDRTNISRV